MPAAAVNRARSAIMAPGFLKRLALRVQASAGVAFVVLLRVLAAAAGLAVGEVKRQQALGKGAVGGRLVFRRVVGADAAWDRFDDDIMVRSEEERARVARAVVAID